MKKYKKIFDIPLFNRTFTIFIDENYRYTFLEKDANGEYKYPELNHFLYLHERLNNIDPFTLNEIEELTFEEKVRMTTMGILSVVVIITSLSVIKTETKRYNTSIKDNTLVVEAETQNQGIAINSFKDLDVLGYDKITIEEMHEKIDNNTSLNQELKTLCHILADELNFNYPNADLRIFFINLEFLNYKEPSREELNANSRDVNIAANFIAETSTMNIPSNTSTEIKIHETGHALTSLKKEINGQLITRSVSFGSSLNEAMNNKVTGLVTSTNTYKREEAILDYFCTCVKFDIEDYINNGISYLIDMLKEKYPNIDISYIVKTLDTMKNVYNEFDVYIYFDSNPAFLDELFLICKSNVNINSANYYTSFTNFAKILEYAQDNSLYYTYLEKYNEHLASLGVDSKKIVTVSQVWEKVVELSEIKGFAYDNAFYPMVYDKPDDDALEPPVKMYKVLKGNKSVSPNDFQGIKNINEKKMKYLIYSCPENYEIMNTPEYWEKMALESGVIDRSEVEPTKLYLKGELIGEELLRNIYLQVGVDTNGEVGFLVTNKNGNTITMSKTNLKNLSNKVALKDYLLPRSDNSKLDLSIYFNEGYLKLFLKEKYYLLSNIYLKADKIEIEPIYKVNIIDESGVTICYLEDLYIDEDIDNNMILEPLGIKLNVPESNFMLGLRHIFEANGILNPEISEYTFTKAQLIELVENYLNKDVNKAR